MPRNESYPYQKPYSQEESYLYDECENYDYDQKPEPKHECKLISAQLSKCDEQEVDEGDAFKFDTFDGVSKDNPHAPLYYNHHDKTITFKKAGRFIVTYGTDIHFKDDYGNDVILALKLDGNTICASTSHAESNSGQELTLSKTALINVHACSTLKLVALQNDKDNKNDFKWTNLVIDEKCKMDNKCD